MLLRENGFVYEPIWSIYIMIDPRPNFLDKNVYYVGMTTDTHGRFDDHLKNSDQDSNKDKWQRTQDIFDAGLVPHFKVVETTIMKRRAEFHEVWWIHYYIQEGHPLTNIIRAPRVDPTGLIVLPEEQVVVLPKQQTPKEPKIPQEKVKVIQYVPRPYSDQLKEYYKDHTPKKPYKHQWCEQREYTFTKEEEQQVLELYASLGNTTKVLRAMRKGARYGKALSNILREAYSYPPIKRVPEPEKSTGAIPRNIGGIGLPVSLREKVPEFWKAIPRVGEWYLDESA